MSDWTPDDSFDADDERDASGVLVTHPDPVRLRLTELTGDERIPPGQHCIAAHLRDAAGGTRIIARAIVPPGMIAQLDTLNDALTAGPVSLAYQARVAAPAPSGEATRTDAGGGLEGMLFALIPGDRLAAWLDDAAPQDGDPDDAWRQSIGPTFEDVRQGRGAASDPAEVTVALYLGNIVRLAMRRRFPDDLIAEAHDVLRVVLSEPLADATALAVEAFLDSL